MRWPWQTKSLPTDQFWPRAAVTRWWETGWDKASLEERGERELWEPQKMRLPLKDRTLTLTEKTAWPSDDWWEEFPVGSGKEYSPFHMPLCSEDGRTLSWKHPNFNEEGIDRDERIKFLKNAIRFRTRSKFADNQTIVTGLVLPFAVRLPEEGWYESAGIALKQVLATETIFLCHAKFGGEISLVDCAAPQEIAVTGIERNGHVHLVQCSSARIVVNKIQTTAELSLEQCAADDLQIDHLERNDSHPKFVRISNSNFLRINIEAQSNTAAIIQGSSILDDVVVESRGEGSSLQINDSQIGRQLHVLGNQDVGLKNVAVLYECKVGHLGLNNFQSENSHFAGPIIFTAPIGVRKVSLSSCYLAQPPEMCPGPEASTNEPKWGTPETISLESTKFVVSPSSLVGLIKPLFLIHRDVRFWSPLLEQTKASCRALKSRFLNKDSWSKIAQEYEMRFRVLRLHFERSGDTNEALNMGVREHKARCLRSGTEWTEKFVSFFYGLIAEHGVKARRLLLWMGLGVPIGMTLWYSNLLGIAPLPPRLDLSIFIYQQTFNPFTGFDFDRFEELKGLADDNNSVWLLVAFSAHRLINILLLFLLGLYIRRRFQIT